MADAAVQLVDDDAVILRRTGVRFPVELRPVGFEPDQLGARPEVAGRLEWIEGRLLYQPPCADVQQEVAVDVVHILRSWSQQLPGYVVGGNEARMKLGADIRAADARCGVARRWGAQKGDCDKRLRLLAVEVAGQDEGEAELREKAAWYLSHGAAVVWLVLPGSREVLQLRSDGESRYGAGEALPADEALPGLTPDVAEFFSQLDDASGEWRWAR